MKEEYHKFNETTIYYRFNTINPQKTTLLFVHGLGDSGLSFTDVFRDGRFDKYNLIVPDLPGHGKSPSGETPDDYSFGAAVDSLWNLLDSLKLHKVILIGHSMGGDITTIMAYSDKQGRVKKYISVEGDITQYDLTISRKTMKVFDKGEFDNWYDNDYKENLVYEKLGQNRSGRLYYAALSFCDKKVFLANALELVKINTALEGKWKSETGKRFLSLEIPKVFCYGTKSLARSTLRFLMETNIRLVPFEGAGHCPMTDMSAEFYDFLAGYVEE